MFRSIRLHCTAILLSLVGTVNAVEVKPEINGTFEDADRAAVRAYVTQTTRSTFPSQDAFCGPGSTNTGCVPSTYWVGLIQGQDYSPRGDPNTVQYIIVQDLIVKDSAAYGVWVGRNNDYVRLSNLDVQYIAHGGLISGVEAWFHMYDNNTVTNTNYCAMWFRARTQSVQVDAALIPDACEVDWPGAISMTQNGPNTQYNYTPNTGTYSSVINNLVYNSFGEGIIASGTHNHHWAGNTVVNTRVGLYAAEGGAHLVEGNIAMKLPSSDPDFNDIGAGIQTFWPTSGWYPVMFSGIDSTVETDIAKEKDTRKNTFRNNFVLGVPSCMVLSHGFSSTWDGLSQVGGIFYNNVCLHSTGRDLYVGEGPAAYDDVIFRNNVMYSPNATNAPDCTPSGTATTQTISHNHWYTNPADSNCDGTGDTYGKPSFSTDPDTLLPSGLTYPADSPDFTDIVPSGSLLNSGTPLITNSTVFDNTDYPWFNSYTAPYNYNGTLWVKLNDIDHDGTDRNDTTPDKGAVEVP
jgi:hypothetical protein